MRVLHRSTCVSPNAMSTHTTKKKWMQSMAKLIKQWFVWLPGIRGCSTTCCNIWSIDMRQSLNIAWRKGVTFMNLLQDWKTYNTNMLWCRGIMGAICACLGFGGHHRHSSGVWCSLAGRRLETCDCRGELWIRCCTALPCYWRMQWLWNNCLNGGFIWRNADALGYYGMEIAIRMRNATARI